MCNKCQSRISHYKIKIIATGRDNIYYPKYIPQIKEICGQCGLYIKFAKQTDELIYNFNKEIEKIII